MEGNGEDGPGGPCWDENRAWAQSWGSRFLHRSRKSSGNDITEVEAKKSFVDDELGETVKIEGRENANGHRRELTKCKGKGDDQT